MLLSGPLRKRPRNGRPGAPQRRHFELEPAALRWYEPAKKGSGKAEAGKERKPKGSLRALRRPMHSKPLARSTLWHPLSRSSD